MFVSNIAEILSPHSVRTALKSIKNPAALGLHPICQLSIVEFQRNRKAYPTTPLGRANAARDVLRRAIDTLQPQASDTLASPRHRTHTILSKQYLEWLSPVAVAELLHLEKSAYHSEQNRALAALSALLAEWEHAAQPAESATEPASPFQAPPRPPYPIIGREAIHARLKADLLDRDAPPHIAISGLPGAGKSTLAIALANDPDVIARFDGGVLWAGLGRQPDLLNALGQWANALLVSRDVIERASTLAQRARLVHNAIGLRHMLLVIDDVWLAEAGEALRIGGPNCAYVFTTRSHRVAVGFAGERALALGELSAGDGRALFQHFARSAMQIAPSECAQLLDATGHLPLAITLVGRYLGEQSSSGSERRVKEALKRLGDTRQRLTLTRRNPPLQRSGDETDDATVSLESVIQFSAQALDPVARGAFEALGVFQPKPASFGEDAACAAADVGPEILDTLVDIGLLETQGGRYLMHQTVSDYARLRSIDGAAGLRLAKHYHGKLADSNGAFDWLDADLPNILHVLESDAAGAALAEERAAIANGLFRHLDDHDLFGIADRVYSRTILVAEQSAAPDALAALRLNRAYFLIKLLRHEEAAVLIDKVDAAQPALQDEQLRSVRLIRSGALAMARGRVDMALQLAETGLAAARVNGWIEPILEGSFTAGVAHRVLGHLPEAEAVLRGALEVAERNGRAIHSVRYLYNLGIIAGWRGDFDDADALYRRGLVIAQQLRNGVRQCLILLELANIACRLMRIDEGEAFAQTAFRLSEEVENPEARIIALHTLGRLALARKNFPEAEQRISAALARARQLDSYLELGVLLTMCELKLETGALVEATTLLTALMSRADPQNDSDVVAAALFCLARIADREGRRDDALRFARESVVAYRKTSAIEGADIARWLAEHERLD